MALFLSQYVKFVYLIISFADIISTCPCSAVDWFPIQNINFTNNSPMELMNELGCQLHRHIRLTLSGLFSVTPDRIKPTHNPGDFWLSTDLIQSALLRLIAPHTLPPYTSLWALANGCMLGSSLDSVITGDQLEVPPGASEVLCNLLSELQLELATNGIQAHATNLNKVYSLQTVSMGRTGPCFVLFI